MNGYQTTGLRFPESYHIAIKKTKVKIGHLNDITLQIRPMSAGQNHELFPIDTHFDVELANRLARLETYNKHYYRPNTYLHKWWARRCGTTFRLILKQLVTDVEARDFYQPGGLEGKLILDPMIGGATTLHEAVRMGANAIGMDLDPIPILQARATLTEYPLETIKKTFKTFFDSLRRELAHFFPAECPECAARVESWYTLYGARRTCGCGEVIMVDSLVIRQEPDGSLVRLCPHGQELLKGEAACRCAGKADVPLVERSNTICPTCHQAYTENTGIPYFKRYEPLVISGHCPDHQFFLRPINEPARDALERANALRPTLKFQRPNFAVEPGQKSIQLLRRGVDNYLDLFTSRQLLVLQSAIAQLNQLDGIVKLNLALLLSTSLEFNSLLSGYKGKNKRRPGAIRHAFAHHAYSFPYTALENNPIYHRRASGTLLKLFQARIVRGRSWAAKPRERDLSGAESRFVEIPGEQDAAQEVTELAELYAGPRRFLLRQGSAAQLDLPDNSIDAIVTDPPYFDSVQYSDLSAFFRVWLKQMLPQAADWHFELRESAVDPHKNDHGSRYAELMSQIFAECWRVLKKEEGRLVFTFHHWDPKAWAALTNALKEAGFTLLNHAVVHSENPISVHIAKMNALTHDAILILAPIGHRLEPQWQRPAAINMDSSEQFCADCATLLGWMLESGLANEAINQLWQEELA